MKLFRLIFVLVSVLVLGTWVLILTEVLEPESGIGKLAGKLLWIVPPWLILEALLGGVLRRNPDEVNEERPPWMDN